MVKVLVSGSRTINNFLTVQQAIVESPWWPTEVERFIIGDADGVDSLAYEFAQEHETPVEIFEAEWQRYGKGAGPIRNSEMVDKADCLIAIWDSESPGTEDAIQKAIGSGLDVFVKQGKDLKYENPPNGIKDW